MTHLVVAPHWESSSLDLDFQDQPVKLAYVIDSSLLIDAVLDNEECDYIAIGDGSVKSYEERGRDDWAAAYEAFPTSQPGNTMTAG